MTKKDLENILRTLQPTGKSGHDRKTLIQRIFKLSRTKIADIMIPLHQCQLVSTKDSVENVKLNASRTRFSRFPVFEGGGHNIIGTINIYDILFSTGEAGSLDNYIKPPFFINENELVDDVLSRLRKRKQPIAIVTDAKGESAGLVTIEDLLEEIVGEIEG